MNNSINKQHKIIDEINNSIIKLLEQTDAERKKDVESVRSDIQYLRSLLYNTNFDLGFNKITLEFYDDYELTLPKYGVESFDRTLKGEMYFSVLGGTKDYIDIKTSSFPNSFKIRLEYETLRELVWQNGYGKLIYESGSQFLVADENKIYFKIIKKS